MEKVERINEASIWVIPSQVDSEGEILEKMFRVFNVYCPRGAVFFALEQMDHDAFFSGMGLMEDPFTEFIDYVKILDVCGDEDDVIDIQCMIDALEMEINDHLQEGLVAGFDPENQAMFLVWSDRWGDDGWD